MIVFRIRDRNHPDYCPIRSNVVAGQFPSMLVNRKGHLYHIGNEPLELFTIKVMAEAIDRTDQTIIGWEKKKIFPKPLFALSVKNLKGKRRLYSGVQILNLHNLMWYKYQARKSLTFDVESWSKDVKEVFFQRKLVVDENGRINLNGVK
jgi:DNA-binding XRE family transcriptional regulator